jgi:hypothetical protein
MRLPNTTGYSIRTAQVEVVRAGAAPRTMLQTGGLSGARPAYGRVDHRVWFYLRLLGPD